jgi:hypothetical protein
VEVRFFFCFHCLLFLLKPKKGSHRVLWQLGTTGFRQGAEASEIAQPFVWDSTVAEGSTKVVLSTGVGDLQVGTGTAPTGNDSANCEQTSSRIPFPAASRFCTPFPCGSVPTLGHSVSFNVVISGKVFPLGRVGELSELEAESVYEVGLSALL